MSAAADLAPPVTASAPDADESTRFVRHAHSVVRDLLAPHPVRYWCDFLITMAIAYAALALYLAAEPWWSPLGAAALTVCGLAMFRGVTFIHEIAHRPSGFQAFTVVWNLLCGVPLLLPSFLYGDHKNHHVNHAYGTWADPEYLVRGSRSRLRRLAFVLLSLVYPLLPPIRFLVLAPLAAVSRRVDRFVWTYGSSLYVMNELYRRQYDDSARSPSRRALEVACSLWAWTVLLLILSGRVAPSILVRAYAVLLFWMAVNQVRTLAAHRYAADSGTPMTYLEQLLDTNTFARGGWLPELWAPLGLRYHALHHLMPALPYHAMGAAHARLVTQLPQGSPYHQTLRPGLASVLTAMLRSSSSSG